MSRAFAITYVATMRGKDEDWLHELSIDMFPEGGRPHVHRGNDDAVTAFTDDGIEYLKQIIADLRTAGQARSPIPIHLAEWPSARCSPDTLDWTVTT
jgi:hypothetical protein